MLFAQSDASIDRLPRSGDITTVLGYHGTTQDKLPSILNQGLRPRRNYWDWLGYGVYFFEDGHHHALAYAEKYCDGTPCVVEADINMSGCLNFFDLPAKEKYRQEYDSYYSIFGREHIKRLRQDERRRPVDCAVFNFMYANLEQDGVPVPVVRCPFDSGGPAWEDPEGQLSPSGVSALGHVQILVRDLTAITGPLRLLNLSRLELDD